MNKKSELTHTKQIGVLTMLSLVVGTLIGGGILVLPSVLAQYGKFGFWAWPVAGVVVMNLAFMFSYLSRKHPTLSGLPGYVKHYFGDIAGFQMSWSVSIGVAMGLAIISISFASYLALMIGIAPTYNMWIALAALWGTLMLQVFCSAISDLTLIIITLLKVLALLLIVIFGIQYFDFAIFSAPSLVETGVMGLMSASSLAFFVFVGFENGTLPGGNVKNAAKVIPLVTIFGTVFAAVLFILTYGVVWSVLPTEHLINTTSSLADAAGAVMGIFGFRLVALLAVIGCLGSINGCLFCIAHILRATSNAGSLPQTFGKLSRAGFPSSGGILGAAITSIPILIYYNAPISMAPMIQKNLAQLEVFLALIAYMYSCMAYKLAKGNNIMWFIGSASCIVFLAGALDDRLSAIVGVATFLLSTFVYTFFKKESNLDEPIILTRE